MLASLLAHRLFLRADSALALHRATSAPIGPVRANLGRLLVAAVVSRSCSRIPLATASRARAWPKLVHAERCHRHGPRRSRAFYAALPLLGSRITVLDDTQCLAAPIAALGEWLLAGHAVGNNAAGVEPKSRGARLILAGVAILPSRRARGIPPRVHVRPIWFSCSASSPPPARASAPSSAGKATCSRRSRRRVKPRATRSSGSTPPITGSSAGFVFDRRWPWFLVFARWLKKLRPPAVCTATPCCAIRPAWALACRSSRPALSPRAR